MQVEHRGVRPVIDETATIAPGAVISGDVHIGPHTVVLANAVITSQGAPVRIGEGCVIMEQAVVRGAGKHACRIADHVLIGPHTHISGAVIHSQCFIATGAAVFNEAIIEEGCVVAIQGVVHIATPLSQRHLRANRAHCFWETGQDLSARRSPGCSQGDWRPWFYKHGFRI